jgi:hypothetical protein
LIQLRQYQSDRLKKQFEFIVQPIMEDLERIQSDYLQMFLEVRVLLADGRATSKDAADLLDARRTLFEPVRQKLMAGFPELDASGFSPPLQKFGKAVLNFFPLGDLYTAGGTSATTLIRELRRLGTERRSFQADLRYFVVEHLADTATHTMWPQQLGPERPWGNDAVACIDWFLDRQRQRWQHVCRAAAAVQFSVASAD